MQKALLATIGLVALFNLFFYPLNLGVGLSIFITLTSIFSFISRDKNSKNLDLALISSSLSILFAFLLSYRSNGIIQFLDLLLSAFFGSTALIFYKNENRFKFDLPNFLLTPLYSAFSYLTSLFNLFFQPKNVTDSSKNTLSAVFKGVFITIPILGVLLILLTNADPIYSKFVGDFFKDIWVRLILSLILFFVYLPIGLITATKFFTQKPEETKNLAHHKSYELMILLGSISLLFASFIIVQFQYLFSNLSERQLHELGIKSLTYSEYVNKGFFELITVSVIVSFILMYVLNIIHKLPAKSKIITQIFASLLTLETALIVLSDFKRLDLYQLSHGLTRARVFGFTFLIWLTLILTIFLISLIYKLKSKIFFYSTLGVTLIIFLVINILNTDEIIATKYKPTVNGKTDYYYISSLSTDAIHGWDQALKDAKIIVNELEQKPEITSDDERKLFYVEKSFNYIMYKTDILRDKYDSDEELDKRHSPDFQGGDIPSKMPYYTDHRTWRSFNWSEYQAYLLIKNSPNFSNLENYPERVSKLKSRSNNPTPILDRDTSPPLIR